MKDNFSQQAASYAQFRPGYPKALFEWLCNQVINRRSALDSGTGNGQVAVQLADYFEEVWATDISEKQLSHTVKENIHYKKEAGEKTDFSDNQFDLLTVAQAIHWYQFDLFYPKQSEFSNPERSLP
jgi:ubiquinone/menaquinone biosynthesis C-methylase UbiE